MDDDQVAADSETTVAAFESDVRAVEEEARRPFEWPEPGLRLEIEKRAGDVARVARHIHQVYSTHNKHFRRSNFVKLAYLGRFFLTEAHANNALGVTAAARGLLELDGFIRYVHAELKDIGGGPATEWQSRGRKYLRISLQSDHPFRMNPITCFGVFVTL